MTKRIWIQKMEQDLRKLKGKKMEGVSTEKRNKEGNLGEDQS